MKQKDYLTIGELAASLGWSVRFVDGLVRGEKLPGLQINGQWRFRRSEIVDWLGHKIQTVDAARIAEIEASIAEQHANGNAGQSGQLGSLIDHLDESAVALDIDATNKIDVLNALLDQAESTGKILDRGHLYASILEREAILATALPGGVAICHPRRPAPSAIRSYLIAFARAEQPVQFGADNGEPTRLFFLLCAPDDASHLHGLARIARILDSVTLAELHHSVDSPRSVIKLLAEREALLSNASQTPV